MAETAVLPSPPRPGRTVEGRRPAEHAHTSATMSFVTWRRGAERSTARHPGTRTGTPTDDTPGGTRTPTDGTPGATSGLPPAAPPDGTGTPTDRAPGREPGLPPTAPPTRTQGSHRHHPYGPDGRAASVRPCPTCVNTGLPG